MKKMLLSLGMILLLISPSIGQIERIEGIGSGLEATFHSDSTVTISWSATDFINNLSLIDIFDGHAKGILSIFK